MQKKLIGVLILSLSFKAHSNFPDIDKALYHPLKDVKDISFEMKASELTKLINSKLLTEIPDDKSWAVYKYSQQEAVDLAQSGELTEGVKSVIEQSILSKASFAWLDSVKKYLKDYKFIKKEDDTYYYEDAEGGLDANELELSFAKGILDVKMKLFNQLEEHQYIYDRKSWSDGKLVLVTIKTIIKKYSETIFTQTDIDYKKVSKRIWFGSKIWLPSKISIVTTQQSQAKTIGKVERSLKEIYVFQNYKVDKDIAHKWFKSHKK